MPLPPGAASTGMHPFNSAIYYAAFGTAAPTSLATVVATFTELANVRNINGVELKPGTTDVTWLRSPNKGKEKIPGWTDAGQITFTVEYTQAVMNALISLYPYPPLTQPAMGRFLMAVVFPDEGVWVATVFLAGIPTKIEGATADDPVTIDATFEISGVPTFFGFND